MIQDNKSVISSSDDLPSDNKNILRFSDFLPIFKTCLYLIIFVIFSSFGLLYCLYNISPDIPEAEHNHFEKINNAI